MRRTLPRLVWMALVLGLACAGGKTAQAAPTCPLFCHFPPDPVPAPPPMPVDDPPMLAAGGGNQTSGSPGRAVAAPAQAARRAVITGKKQAGGVCMSGKLEGTVVEKDGKYTCNFAPSTLPVGGACHALKRLGTVTVIDGERYCQLTP